MSDGETNATLPRETKADEITLEAALELLVARRAAAPPKRPARGGRAAPRAKTAAPAKTSAAKATAKPKTAAKKGGAKKAAKG